MGELQSKHLSRVSLYFSFFLYKYSPCFRLYINIFRPRSAYAYYDAPWWNERQHTVAVNKAYKINPPVKVSTIPVLGGKVRRIVKRIHSRIKISMNKLK